MLSSFISHFMSTVFNVLVHWTLEHWNFAYSPRGSIAKLLNFHLHLVCPILKWNFFRDAASRTINNTSIWTSFYFIYFWNVHISVMAIGYKLKTLNLPILIKSFFKLLFYLISIIKYKLKLFSTYLFRVLHIWQAKQRDSFMSRVSISRK